MDLHRIAIRAVFAYVVLLILVRLSGKRAVRQASPLDFTVSLILGDMVDDALWAEVNASLFVVATSALLIAHSLGEVWRYKAGSAK